MPDLPAAPANEANPWDFAYARVADQLGVAEDDVIFAEPDRVHDEAFVVDSEGITTCTAIPQDGAEVKLTKAGVTASIPLDDGSDQFGNVAWDGTNLPLQVSGNNGLLNTDTPRHMVNRCITENRNSHQKYRSGVRATGTIDGTDVTTFPYLGPFSPLL